MGVVPLSPHLQQFITQGVLFGLVGVQFLNRLQIRLWVWVSWIGDVRVWLVSWRLGSVVHRRYKGGSLVAVNVKAALTWHFEKLRGGTGWGSQGYMAWAEGQTAHRSIDAGALVLATSTEILTTLINLPIVFT